MTTDADKLGDRARQIFRNAATSLTELISLAAALRRANQLDDARRLLDKALFEYSADADPELRTKLLRDLMLCTYKDPDLPTDTRLQQAEQTLSTVLGERPHKEEYPPHPIILALAGSLDSFPRLKQDLLGIAGAVQKRRWDIYGLRVHLVRSYQYYRRGYEMGCANDRGYNAINLAFVLDLLSEQEKGELDGGKAARDMASNVRKEVVAVLDPLNEVETEQEYAKLADPDLLGDWWVLVTLGEAWLGLGDYPKAIDWMTRAARLQESLAHDEDVAKHIAPWQLETSARQIAQGARIRAQREGIPPDALEASAPWGVVKALLANHSKAAESFLRGKIGLALSGGGFRASLFHIGVLAKLAELDVLRHVEVLSCVSGGSILGAYYYLELRNMLQQHTDREITRQTYIDLVKRIRENFLAGVQRNIRLRMLLGWSSNARVLTSRRSSSSDRLAILYEKELYARVDDGEQGRPRYLADLLVAPLIVTMSADGQETRQRATNFNPRYDNWKRLNKVPALVLNATSLNSCHNWQFTASFMGEPPARSIDAEIDANNRMRRMYHWEAPPPYRRNGQDSDTGRGVRLGEAVAASACVPGLFTPLVLENLYGKLGPENQDYVKRLVDGGNYDNQGTSSLREQDCTVLIVSDACGQTGMSLEPPSGHVGVLMRANDILMARTREAQYQLLSTLSDGGAIHGVMYLHLKKGLQAQVVDWVNCDDPSTYQEPKTKTSYGVRTDIQRLLASVRTDLDSFSWLESDALMLSGYLMTGEEWNKCLPHIQTAPAAPVWWDFQRLESTMTAENENTAGNSLRELKTGLKAAENLVFKPFELYPILHKISVAFGILILALIVWGVIAHWSSPIPHAGRVIAIVVLTMIVLIAVKEILLQRVMKYRNSYLQIFGSVFMCTLGWIIFYPYLLWIDPLYINWGSGYRQQPAQQPGAHGLLQPPLG